MPWINAYNRALPFEFSTWTQKIAARVSAPKQKKKHRFPFFSKQKDELPPIQPINAAYLTIIGHGLEIKQSQSNFIANNAHISYFEIGAQFLQNIAQGIDKSTIDLREYQGFFKEILFWSKPGHTLIAPKNSLEGRALIAQVLQSEAIQPRTIHTPAHEPLISNIFLSPQFDASHWTPDPELLDIRNQIMYSSETPKPDKIFSVLLPGSPDSPHTRRPALRWPHDVISITHPCLLSHILNFLFENKICYQKIFIFSCRRIVPITESDFVPDPTLHDFLVSTQFAEQLEFAKQPHQQSLESRTHHIQTLRIQKEALEDEIATLERQVWDAIDKKDVEAQRRYQDQIKPLRAQKDQITREYDALTDDYSTEPKIRQLLDQFNAIQKVWPKW